MILKKKFGEKYEISMFSLSKPTSKNMYTFSFSPNFFFKIIFLQDEKIFFDQILLTSSTVLELPIPTVSGTVPVLETADSSVFYVFSKIYTNTFWNLVDLA